MPNPRTKPPTIRELFPGATEEELAEYEEALQLYFKTVIRIVDRISGADDED